MKNEEPNVDPRRPPPGSVLVWLVVVYAMIFAMVIIGGTTRLTGSGLSMVEWHPLMGALPPLDEASWQVVFEKYQQSPQYQKVNHWMTLADFKRIFFWEYLHRLSGRLIGLVFFVPFVVFKVRKQLWGSWSRRSFWAFVFGGLQGVLGWVMVKSGLVDVPAVSHYRLAAHLSLAFFVGGWVLWLILDILRARRSKDDADGLSEPTAKKLSRAVWSFIALLGVQIVYGAFMAGKRAGHVSATFPDMNGEWIPDAAFAMEPAWHNYLENPYGIHFIHRVLGWLTLAAVVGLAALVWRSGCVGRPRKTAQALLALTAVQFALGALTVVFHVPLSLAVTHQAGGFLLLSAALVAAHSLRRPALR